MSKFKLEQIEGMPIGCYKPTGGKPRRPTNGDYGTIINQLEGIEHIDISIKDKKIVDIDWGYAVDTKKQAIRILKNAIKELEK